MQEERLINVDSDMAGSAAGSMVTPVVIVVLVQGEAGVGRVFLLAGGQAAGNPTQRKDTLISVADPLGRPSQVIIVAA